MSGDRCPGCGRRVYAAERQFAFGGHWHGLCLGAERKARQARAKESDLVGNYAPDGQPVKGSLAVVKGSRAAASSPASSSPSP